MVQIIIFVMGRNSGNAGFGKKNSHLEWAECNLEYLQQEVRWIVQQHHNCTNPNVVVTVGEANQWDGSNVMNDLLFEVLQATDMTNYRTALV